MKTSTQVSQRAQTTYATIAVAEKQSKRSKVDQFSLYIRSPGSHAGNGMNGTRRGRSLPVHPGFSSHSCTRDSAWINVRFGSAQASDQLKTRLEARDSARLCSETKIDISSRGGRAYRALDFQVSIVKSSHLHILQHMFEIFVMWNNRTSLQHGSGLTLADISRFIGHCRYIKFLLRPSP